MPSSYELIVFDWDGTLADSAAHIVSSLQTASRALNLTEPTDADIRQNIGLSIDESLQSLFPGLDLRMHVKLKQQYRECFYSGTQEAHALFPHVLSTLEQLKAANYLLAVATGKGRQGLDSALAATGLGQFMDATRTADEAPSKPHPQMLMEILDQLGVSPQAAIMIGDTEYDMEMAQQAGVPAIAVDYGVHSTDQLNKFAPLACLGSIDELLPWLDVKR